MWKRTPPGPLKTKLAKTRNLHTKRHMQAIPRTEAKCQKTELDKIAAGDPDATARLYKRMKTCMKKDGVDDLLDKQGALIASTDKQKAEILHARHKSVANELSSREHEDTHKLFPRSNCMPNSLTKPHVTPPITDAITDWQEWAHQKISSQETIHNVANRLNVKACPGPDQLEPKLLTLINHNNSFFEALTLLYNWSLALSKIPVAPWAIFS